MVLTCRYNCAGVILDCVLSQSMGESMKNATIEELEAGLDEAYNRAFALRARLKSAKTTIEFRRIKHDLDHEVENVVTIDGEIQRRMHNRESLPA